MARKKSRCGRTLFVFGHVGILIDRPPGMARLPFAKSSNFTPPKKECNRQKRKVNNKLGKKVRKRPPIGLCVALEPFRKERGLAAARRAHYPRGTVILRKLPAGIGPATCGRNLADYGAAEKWGP